MELVDCFDLLANTPVGCIGALQGGALGVKVKDIRMAGGVRINGRTHAALLRGTPQFEDVPAMCRAESRACADSKWQLVDLTSLAAMHALCSIRIDIFG
jgi:hypothetical protein